MDYRRSEVANIDNRRCRFAAATMNLVVTPLSGDLKKNEAGVDEFFGVFFFFTPIHRRFHADHVHLKVQITSMRSGGGGGLKKLPHADLGSIFLKSLLSMRRTSNVYIRGASSLYFRTANSSEWCC